MKKSLNETAISNELHSGSSFFQRSPDRANDRSGSDPVQVFDRSTERSITPKRVARRYSFEIYEDQIQTLKRMKAESMLAGGDRSISSIVREALDDYLK